MTLYAIAHLPTPVLTTPAFELYFGGETNDRLLLDSKQLLRPVEIVLLPQSKIELLEKMADPFIWQICTNEHACPNPLFIDERFVSFCNAIPTERKCILPSIEKVLTHLKQQIGARYIWGGNWPQGIPQLLEWYTSSIHAERLDPLIYDTWQLKGVDCSGLLYFATQGYTPRNTSELVTWGQSIFIEQKTIDEIIASIFPLDLIVWKGHVIIILDSQTVIESKEGKGVITSSLKMRLQEICQDKQPLNTYTTEAPSFVMRRWHPDSLYLPEEPF